MLTYESVCFLDLSAIKQIEKWDYDDKERKVIEIDGCVEGAQTFEDVEHRHLLTLLSLLFSLNLLHLFLLLQRDVIQKVLELLVPNPCFRLFVFLRNPQYSIGFSNNHKGIGFDCTLDAEVGATPGIVFWRLYQNPKCDKLLNYFSNIGLRQ